MRRAAAAPRQCIPATVSCRRTPNSPRPARRPGIVFIGPPASAMRAMGSKAEAKELMQRHGVPLVPGYHGDDQNPARLLDEAERIGFPVLIKASAGGGGRGMRVVGSAAEFAAALAGAKREAEAAFGDGRVLLEKYLAAAAAHRNPDLRRPARQHGASLRARLLDPAAASEGAGGGAGAGARSGAAQRHGRRRRWPPRAPSAMSAPAPSSSSPKPATSTSSR